MLCCVFSVLCCAALCCAVLAMPIKLALLYTVASACQSNVTASQAYLKSVMRRLSFPMFHCRSALHCCSEPDDSSQPHRNHASTHLQVQLRAVDMSYADFLSKGDGGRPVAPHVADASDTCNILFSSGTTGELCLCASQLSMESRLK